MNKLHSILINGALALSLAACQPIVAPPAAAPAMPEVTIKLTDQGLVVPAEIPAGVVTVTTENDLSPAKQDPTRCGDGIVLVQLSAGVSKTAFLEAAAQGMPDLKLGTLLGGSCAKNDAPAHDIFDLQPGSYLAVRISETPDVAEINVKETGNQAAAPTATVKVQMVDFSFIMPDEIKAGAQLWEFTNNGKQAHFMDIVRLKDGVSLDDFLKAVMAEHPSGPPPATEPAYWSITNPGATGWSHLNLEPGVYYALCFASDTASQEHKMHVQEGMVRMFKVVK
ncbi:MAG: hypothetical protein U0350_06520 [Caldilineaceae bacterium]